MNLFSNPIVMCSSIALGIVFILVIVVVFCCKKSSDKEREELKALSEEIEANTVEESEVSTFSDDKIESVLSKMQDALELKEENSVSFEEEQEENAIISYQELLESLGAKSSINVDAIEVYDDELDNQVEISDFNKEIIDAYQNESLEREIYRFQNDYSSQEMPIEFSDEKPVMNFQSVELDNNVEQEPVYEAKRVEEEPVYEARHVVGKFKKSEIISPVYGIVSDKAPVSKVEEVEEIIFDDFI